MSEKEKEAIKMLNKYITEHKLFNIKQADNLEKNIEIVLNLLYEIYTKFNNKTTLLKFKFEEIEKLQKEIDKKNKYIESLENTNMEQDMMITGLKEDRRLASEEIADYIKEEDCILKDKIITEIFRLNIDIENIKEKLKSAHDYDRSKSRLQAYLSKTKEMIKRLEKLLEE